MSSNAPKSTTTTTVSEPWKGSQSALKDIINQSKALFESGSYAARSPDFETVLDYSPTTQQAIDLTKETAAAGAPLSEQAQQNMLARLNGNNPAFNFYESLMAGEGMPGLDRLRETALGAPGANPRLQGILDAGYADVQDQLNSNAALAGRVGSPAHARAIAEGVGELGNQLRYQDFTTQQNRQDTALRDLLGAQQTGARGVEELDRYNLGAAGSMDTILQGIADANANRLMTAGGLEEAKEREILDDRIARHYEDENADVEALANYQNVITQLAGLGSSSSSTNPRQGASFTQGLLQNMMRSGLGHAGSIVGGSIGGIPGAMVGGIFDGLI